MDQLSNGLSNLMLQIRENVNEVQIDDLNHPLYSSKIQGMSRKESNCITTLDL